MAGKKRDGDCGEMDGDFAIRLLHALNHKVRRRILRRLAEADGAVSPVVISRELGIPLGIVSYHVTTLRHCKTVEQTKVEPVRGAVEHFYRTLMEGNMVADTLLEATREVDGDSTK
jgi:DNA-binding transcriptional ArsR family regulator